MMPAARLDSEWHRVSPFSPIGLFGEGEDKFGDVGAAEHGESDVP